MSFNGKILKINLTTSDISIEEQDNKFYRKYSGGHGVGLYYLLKETRGSYDPFSPESPLIFAPGLLAGLRAPAVPRFVVLGKSPLTNALGKSEAGGWWGPELKKAGFDAVIITGESSKPVYIFIKDGEAEIKDASHLWGLETGKTQDLIRSELGDKKIQIAQIGPAGEKKVLYANIVNNLAHFNGRNGLGAVMGSKKLKAIAVRGTGKLETTDGEAISEISRWAASGVKDHPLCSMLHEHGTPAGVKTVNAQGGLPTNHFSLGVFEKADDLASEEYSLAPKGCYACPVVCKRVVEIDDGDIVVDKKYGGPEYETLVALGSNCGIGNLKIVAKANELCNRNTLDTISLGMTISFAMRCYEEGIIGNDITDGMELRFGNEDILLPLIEKIVRREGFGDILADGSNLAAERFGPESKKYLINSKGQEAPMHDPRVKSGLGLQYALSVCGADHWFAQHDPFFAAPDGFGVKEMSPLGITDSLDPLEIGTPKVKMVYYTSILNSAYDTLGVCVFGYVVRSLIPLDKLLELLSAATGWNTSLWEIMKVGERALVMSREFNRRQGLGPSDDNISPVFFIPLERGPFAGKTTINQVEFNEAISTYQAMSGLKPDGGICDGKLSELELEWLSEEKT
jgi:aldehyde:ferredoxin oxidoreductase